MENITYDNKRLAGYTLAIPAIPQVFKHLRPGAVYWIAASTPTDAIRLAGQTLALADASCKAILLGSSELDEVLAFLSNPELGPAELRSYKLRVVSPQLMWDLPKQIDRFLDPKQRLIVLLMPVNETLFWQTNAAILLKQWRNWAEDNVCTLLVISYGANAIVLSQELYVENRSLSGLATISSFENESENELFYQIWHWRSSLGAQGEERFKLRSTDTHFELIRDDSNQKVVSSNKKNIVIFQREVLEGAPISMAENWQVVEAWDELIEKGLNSISATLVFGLSSHEDLATLARTLYHLREQRTDAVKLIIREMCPALRKQEMDLLMLCGASLVVPVEVKLVHFFSQLEGIINQPSVYELTDNLEESIAITRPQQKYGIMTPALFCDHVEETIKSISTHNFSGVLVALRPVPMLSAEMVLSQIKLTRMGDVACAVNDVVYVFLFDCDPNFVILALQRLFKLPFTEMVIEDHSYSTPISIEEQVLYIRSQPVSESNVVHIDFLPVEEVEKKHVFQPVLKHFIN